MSPLVIIDANNQLHRLYHAMGALSAAKAWKRHLQTFCKLLAGGDCSKVYVAFDGPGGSAWRTKIEPAYKGERPEKQADLIELLGDARFAAAEAGHEVLCAPGAEADDLIAAVVSQHADRCVMVSSDKDLHQLLEAGRVNQLRKYSVKGGELVDCRWYTAVGFTDQYKILPEQWPTWKAIAGDKSDDLSGVPQCGPVCASKVVSKYPSVAAIAAADPWQLPCKNVERTNLRRAIESGDLAKWEEISTLRRDCLDLAFQGAS